MCLIAWRWKPEEASKLILLSNRDEFYARPTSPLSRWPNGTILAGRDELAGGTWLGCNTRGWVAAVTNFREPGSTHQSRLSRGHLVQRFLESADDPAGFVKQLTQEFRHYSGFNLLMSDGVSLSGFEGRGNDHRHHVLPPGYGSVSNAGFNAAWPKAVWLQSRMRSMVEKGDWLEDSLLDLLLHEEKAPDHLLPATGLPIERERALSSPFIRLEGYGTRACSLIHLGPQSLTFKERVFGPQGLMGVYRENLIIPSSRCVPMRHEMT